MQRLAKIIRALFDTRIHVLTDEELFEKEHEAAQIGYAVAERDYKGEVQYGEAFINGIKVQVPIN